MTAPQPEPVSPEPDLAGTTVGRFAVRQLVAVGGMGEVYRADDTKLRRPVALKRLNRRLRNDPHSRQSILAEAQRSSSLSSPHIAGIYDVFETSDDVFLVMEYVEGSSLRHHLRERGPMPADQFLALAIQCAEALNAAHRHGIIHRDLKPENIMLTADGQVKVLDFGLAQHLPVVDEKFETASVDEGRGVVGTPGYMAPEAVLERRVDARADIFSLGVVFYEMLTGEHPFRPVKPVVVADQVLHSPLSRLSEPGSMPAALRQVISRMLARDPAERYPSAAELLRDLKAVQRGEQPGLPGLSRRARILTAVTAVFAVLAVVLLMPVGTAPGPSFTERDWVLISDFDNSTGDPIFDRTLNEALTIALQQSTYVNVLPRKRVHDALQRMQRSDTPRLDEVLGRELCQREGVRVLLAGSIHRSGQAFQIRVRALEPGSARLLFAEEQQFQRSEDLFDSVDTLAKRVRGGLGEALPQIEKSSRPLARVTTQSLEALQLYSRAVDDISRSKLDSAAAQLQAALALDPDFAMAHYKLASVYQTLGDRRRETGEMERAYALRSRVSERERYLIEAEYHGVHGRYEQVVQALEVLVNLYPDDAEAHESLAAAHISADRHDLAVQDLRQVLRLNPYAAGAYPTLVLLLAYTNANQEALETYSLAVGRNLRSPRLEWGRAMALLGADRLEEARATLRGIEDDPGYGNIARIYLARAEIYEGRLAAALDRLNADMQVDIRSGRRSPEAVRRYLLARIYLLRGDSRSALQQLNAIVARGEPRALQARDLRWAGALYAQMGDLRGARDVLQRLDRLRLDVPAAYNQSCWLGVRGEVELAAGRTGDAVHSFQQALAAAPQFWAHSGLARAHARGQDWAAARDEWQRVIDSKGEIFRDGLPADWVLAHLEIARAYRALGESQQAAAHYRRFLQLWAQADPLPVIVVAQRELQELERSSSPPSRPAPGPR